VEYRYSVLSLRQLFSSISEEGYFLVFLLFLGKFAGVHEFLKKAKYEKPGKMCESCKKVALII
jgi:hypothetical protein